MIGVLHPYDSAEAGRYVLAALRRSVSATQALPISLAGLGEVAPDVLVAVDLPEAWSGAVLDWLGMRGRKLALFGRVPPTLCRELGCSGAALPDGMAHASRSASAPSHESRESAATVQYGPRAAALGANAWRRAFERFDFTDEWNNLGFGAIRADGSPWSVAGCQQAGADAELAAVEIGGVHAFSYAALWDRERASVFWVNRSVGLCDSFEWLLVERFVSSYRSDVLPCVPVLSEIPWGHDAAITSRLDCDEDVESARPLWNAYRRLGVPFSLAVHTRNLDDGRHHGILRELVSEGGAVLSHTATHAPNWGGSYDAALLEGRGSAERLEALLGKAVRYAVSPFHQSPPYALHALADAGYEGCVGGIIRNDPEFVLARGGVPADMGAGFIGHSQQCMLHGDCMLAEGDPLAVFRAAFDLACESRSLFGYLDHPFSERYQYGWTDEPSRVAAHETFVAYMRERARNPLFLTEDDALDFLKFKSLTGVVSDGGGYRFVLPAIQPHGLPLAAEFRGELVRVAAGGRLE